jgi:hypothetical protein
MIFALAVLLLQPHVQPQPKIQVSQLDASASASSPAVAGPSNSAAGSPVTPAVTPAEFPTPTPAASPEPYPEAPIVLSPAPDAASESSSSFLGAPPAMAASIHSWKTVVSNVIDPQFETRRDHWTWLSLSIAQHSAAGFDAWTTRQEISSGQGQELNPLLKPFAGNDSLYVVTQITPVALDYLAHHMMYSSHRWERRAWWVPQVLGTASSFAAGGHNLTVRANPAQ